MRLLITRPVEDAAPLKAQLEGLGHAVLLAPMMEIVLHPRSLDLAGCQAFLVTSANGVRALAASTLRRDVPVFAVGDASAQAARHAGFVKVESASGDAPALAALVNARLNPAQGKLFHAAGTVTAGDLKAALEQAGFTVERQSLYEARAVATLPLEAMVALKNKTLDGVLLFSPRTARIFAQLVQQAGLAAGLDGAQAFCLSQAVGDVAQSLPFGGVAIAPSMDTAGMLSVLVASHRGLN